MDLRPEHAAQAGQGRRPPPVRRLEADHGAPFAFAWGPDDVPRARRGGGERVDGGSTTRARAERLSRVHRRCGGRLSRRTRRFARPRRRCEYSRRPLEGAACVLPHPDRRPTTAAKRSASGRAGRVVAQVKSPAGAARRQLQERQPWEQTGACSAAYDAMLAVPAPCAAYVSSMLMGEGDEYDTPDNDNSGCEVRDRELGLVGCWWVQRYPPTVLSLRQGDKKRLPAKGGGDLVARCSLVGSGAPCRTPRPRT